MVPEGLARSVLNVYHKRPRSGALLPEEFLDWSRGRAVGADVRHVGEDDLAAVSAKPSKILAAAVASRRERISCHRR